MKSLLTVVIPCYNEEAMIRITATTIHEILSNANINHELVFIDDGSCDQTWDNISETVNFLSCVKGVRFSRNFGKEAAISCGLSYAKGDCAVIIDCDLQHPPEKIVDMYKLWEQGYEVVEAVKKERGKESLVHAFCARWFYNLISSATKLDMRRASDFKLLDRKAISALLNVKESNSFFRALSSWIGFKTVQVEFEVQERMQGTTKWSTWSLIKYAVSNITSFSAAPMQIITVLGAVTFILSLVMGTISLVDKFLGQALEGFTTVIILQLFFSSIIMLSLGIIGHYIEKIYDEIKGRPKFIISEICDKE